ncbi:MAG: hypothetical protein NT167_28510, partial [Verrucomicrobia bacterium]|nr:hypothetical protein [Verrucomicrobiota bacterium]
MKRSQSKPSPRRSTSAACRPSPPATRDILLAVTGDSPAILTETIWFLATQAEDAFVPHEVLAVTTTRGKSAIEKQLLGQASSAGGITIWDALSQALAARGIPVEARLQLRIRLIEQTSPKPGAVRELEDIRDRKE